MTSTKRGDTMKATQLLHDLGQSLWLDNITRDLLDSGTLKRYIDELSVTGSPRIRRSSTTPSRTARPTTPPSARSWRKGKSGEALFFDLALEDITRAADLFRPIHDRTNGVDGWVSLEVSPLLAHDTASTLRRGQRSVRARGAAEPVHQDPRHEGRPARHRGGDLRRHSGQCDAPVLARAVPGGRRGLPARHRAAHRGRAQSQRRLGRVGVHQPLGRRGRGQSARRAAQPARHRHREAHLQGVPRACSARRAGSEPTTPARARNACCGPAREPRIRRPRTSCTSKRWPRRSP